MSKLSSLTIKGYKSIQNLENLKLGNLNILLGANGAGKSNFISVFKFLADMYEQNLQLHVQNNGGPDALLHYGRKKTPEMQMAFYFDKNGYEFSLIPTKDNRLIFKREMLGYLGGKNPINHRPMPAKWEVIGKSHSEALLKESSRTYAQFIKPAIERWRVYHFHDTSDTALIKQPQLTNDNLRLKTDAANLAPFLLRLKNEAPQNYGQIVKTIRLAAPFFHDFVLREDRPNIELEWFEKGDYTPWKAHILSDGTLRFICLATLLLQPFSMIKFGRHTETILIDEPELGLHPYALAVLADLIKRAAEQIQVIICTQSVELINHFSANDIIVVDRINDASVFKRLDEEQLKDWLEDYTLGDLWKQNIIGGRPSR